MRQGQVFLVHTVRTDKGQKSAKAATPKVDVELERLKKTWCERRDQLKGELLLLQGDPRHESMARDLLNLIKALDVRDRLLDARETVMSQKEASIEGQKQRLSQQAERLAQLRNELECKINELEKRLAALENIE